LAKTFIGEEAIQALKEYIEARRKGSRNVAQETITKNSPLFKSWTHGEVRRISRHSLSSLIRETFVNVNEERMSAHSLRKKLQTDLEKAGVNPNWIDQILGHELINSRDAYSLPTDEELKEAYTKAYSIIRIYPEIHQEPQTSKQQAIPPTAQTQTEEIIEIKANGIHAIKQALLKGYRHVDPVDGIRLYMKNQ
jgi:hypothetical protein